MVVLRWGGAVLLPHMFGSSDSGGKIQEGFFHVVTMQRRPVGQQVCSPGEPDDPVRCVCNCELAVYIQTSCLLSSYCSVQLHQQTCFLCLFLLFFLWTTNISEASIFNWEGGIRHSNTEICQQSRECILTMAIFNCFIVINIKY